MGTVTNYSKVAESICCICEQPIGWNSFLANVKRKYTYIHWACAPNVKIYDNVDEGYPPF